MLTIGSFNYQQENTSNVDLECTSTNLQKYILETLHSRFSIDEMTESGYINIDTIGAILSQKKLLMDKYKRMGIQKYNFLANFVASIDIPIPFIHIPHWNLRPKVRLSHPKEEDLIRIITLNVFVRNSTAFKSNGDIRFLYKESAELKSIEKWLIGEWKKRMSVEMFPDPLTFKYNIASDIIRSSSYAKVPELLSYIEDPIIICDISNAYGSIRRDILYRVLLNGAKEYFTAEYQQDAEQMVDMYFNIIDNVLFNCNDIRSLEYNLIQPMFLKPEITDENELRRIANRQKELQSIFESEFLDSLKVFKKEYTENSSLRLLFLYDLYKRTYGKDFEDENIEHRYKYQPAKEVSKYDMSARIAEVQNHSTMIYQGLIPGMITSNFMFTLFLGLGLKKVLPEIKQRYNVLIYAYVDDFVVVGKTIENARLAFQELSNAIKELGLNFSTNKYREYNIPNVYRNGMFLGSPLSSYSMTALKTIYDYKYSTRIESDLDTTEELPHHIIYLVKKIKRYYDESYYYAGVQKIPMHDNLTFDYNHRVLKYFVSFFNENIQKIDKFLDIYICTATDDNIQHFKATLFDDELTEIVNFGPSFVNDSSNPLQEMSHIHTQKMFISMIQSKIDSCSTHQINMFPLQISCDVSRRIHTIFSNIVRMLNQFKVTNDPKYLQYVPENETIELYIKIIKNSDEEYYFTTDLQDPIEVPNLYETQHSVKVYLIIQTGLTASITNNKIIICDTPQNIINARRLAIQHNIE